MGPTVNRERGWSRALKNILYPSSVVLAAGTNPTASILYSFIQRPQTRRLVTLTYHPTRFLRTIAHYCPFLTKQSTKLNSLFLSTYDSHVRRRPSMTLPRLKTRVSDSLSAGANPVRHVHAPAPQWVAPTCMHEIICLHGHKWYHHRYPCHVLYMNMDMENDVLRLKYQEHKQQALKR